MNILLFLLIAGLPQGGAESTLEKIEREITAVVEKTRPSVVHVTASSGDEAFQNSIGTPEVKRLTGIIVSAEGYIITDLGAVESARHILVTLHDGRSLEAERQGVDRLTSIALLRVKARGLAAVEFAEPSAIRQGSIAVLVSNPGGLRESCSVGFVSGLGRCVRVNGSTFDDLIQTSAAVQAGDAGGLLANARGLVVGMIHSRYVPDGLSPDPAGFLRPVPRTGIDFLPSGGPSIGFATPASTLKFVADRLMKQGRVVRGWAGLTVRRLGTSAQIAAVIPRGPAAKSGLRAGDLIAEIDGQALTDIGALKRRVVESPASSKVRVRVLRGDATLEMDLTIEPEPEQ